MPENDLVEKPLSKGEGAIVGGEAPTEGAGAIDSGTKACEAFGQGDWGEGLANAGGTALDVVGVGLDPLAGIAAAGFGWAMEHVSFLREPLDALAGDPPAIESMSKTWENVGNEVKQAAGQFEQQVKSETAHWQGQAMDAYRGFASEQVKAYQGVAVACESMSAGVKTAGEIISVVRGIVRDLISQAVGEIVAALVEWAAASAGTLGAAVPAAIADICRRAVKWADKIATWTSKVVKVLQAGVTKLDELAGGTGKISKAITTAVEKVSGGSAAARSQIADAGGPGIHGLGQLDEATAKGVTTLGHTAYGQAVKVGLEPDLAGDAAKTGWEGVKKVTELDNESPDESGDHDGQRRPTAYQEQQEQRTSWGGTL